MGPLPGAPDGAGVRDLAELAYRRRAEVLALHVMGPNGMATLEAALHSAGLAWADEPAPEIPLAGGDVTADVVRVGDTVRRPRQVQSAFVEAYRRHLEARAFEGAPRLFGVDERGPTRSERRRAWLVRERERLTEALMAATLAPRGDRGVSAGDAKRSRTCVRYVESHARLHA